VSGPHFDELVGRDVPPDERERLLRAHDALVAAGAPPDLPPTLQFAPGTDEHLAEVRTLPGRYYAPRRVVAGVLAAAMIAAAAFGLGYFIRGDAGGDQGPAARRYVALVELHGDTAPNALAAVRVTAPDTIGNREMIVTVEGLPKLEGGDYYTLFMTKGAKPIVTCGTFNVHGGVRRTTVRLVGAYDPSEFDGFALAKYSAVTHENTVVLSGDIV